MSLDAYLALLPPVENPKPAAPSPFHQWDELAERWFDPRSLAQAKADAWEEIKWHREAAFAARAVSAAGVAYTITKDKGNLADRRASLEDSIIVGAATEETAIEWRDFDDQVHMMTLFNLRMLAAEMGARGQAIFVRSWVLDQTVKASSTNEEVDLVLAEINEGWPQ